MILLAIQSNVGTVEAMMFAYYGSYIADIVRPENDYLSCTTRCLLTDEYHALAFSGSVIQSGCSIMEPPIGLTDVVDVALWAYRTENSLLKDLGLWL